MSYTQYQFTDSQYNSIIGNWSKYWPTNCQRHVRVLLQVLMILIQVQQGDIIVTNMTDPDWVPALKRAAGIITQMGGRTCHAAIVSRELHIPALVGAA